MFERYVESSRRALFIARNSAVSVQSALIEPEHLLFGAIEAWPAPTACRADVACALGLTMPEQVPGSAIPQIEFSPIVKRLLADTTLQADWLGHHRIRPEHLLLGLLESIGHASTILRGAGIDREMLIESADRDAAVDDSPLPVGDRRVRVAPYYKKLDRGRDGTS